MSGSVELGYDVAKQFLVAGNNLGLGQRTGNPGLVDEIAPGDVVIDRIVAPGSAAQREAEYDKRKGKHIENTEDYQKHEKQSHAERYLEYRSLTKYGGPFLTQSRRRNPMGLVSIPTVGGAILRNMDPPPPNMVQQSRVRLPLCDVQRVSVQTLRESFTKGCQGLARVSIKFIPDEKAAARCHDLTSVLRA